jgi:hypothetical protein
LFSTWSHDLHSIDKGSDFGLHSINKTPFYYETSFLSLSHLATQDLAGVINQPSVQSLQLVKHCLHVPENVSTVATDSLSVDIFTFSLRVSKDAFSAELKSFKVIDTKPTSH